MLPAWDLFCHIKNKPYFSQDLEVELVIAVGSCQLLVLGVVGASPPGLTTCSGTDCQGEFLPPEAGVGACTGAKPAAACPLTSRGYATWMPGRLKVRGSVCVLMIKPINLFKETTPLFSFCCSHVVCSSRYFLCSPADLELPL